MKPLASRLSVKLKLRKHIMAGLANLLMVLTGLAGIEVLGQLYFDGNPNYFSDQRFIYTTPDSFRNVGKFWTYKPNSKIHEIAMYRSSMGSFFKEYECHYETDQEGFFNPPSARRKYDVLVLGDSFTSASAGCSWMPTLRAKAPGLSIYNAALPGTGLGNWAEMQRYLVQEGYEFGHVVMVFISGDFSRTLRQKKDSELECLHDLARCEWHVFYPLFPEMDLREISERRGPHQVTKKLEYFWRRHFWVTHYLYFNGLIDNPLLRKRDTRVATLSKETEQAFERIVQMSKSIDFVRVTTKDEVVYKTELADTVAVSEFMANRGLSYRTCVLTIDDFFRYDPHANERGYRKLAGCVADVVRGF